MSEIEFLTRDAAPPAYDIRDLGMLEDGRLCHGHGINSHGDVVGEADTTLGVHAFVWRGGEIEDTGTLGGVYSSATDINDDGALIGVTELSPGGARVSFLRQDGRMINLRGLGIRGDGVRAINNDGWIVGEMSFGEERDPGAFLWQYGNVVDLAGPHVKGSSAEAINDSGQVVGYLSQLQQYDQAFLWSQGRLIDLGLGQAYGISDRGLIVGMTYQGGGKPLACLWSDLNRRELPLPERFTESRALDVNTAEEIVGEMGAATGTRAAFLWKREYTIDLNDVIDTSLGWNLQEARAINDAGQIVGWGFLEHRHHGFILTPTDRRDRRGMRLPPPKSGAAAISLPDVIEDKEESSLSFQEIILNMVKDPDR